MNYIVGSSNDNEIPFIIKDIINRIYGNTEWNIYSAFNSNFISGLMTKENLELLCENHLIKSNNNLYRVNINIYNYLYEINYNNVSNTNDRQFIVMNYKDISVEEKLLYNYLRDSYFKNIGLYRNY